MQVVVACAQFSGAIPEVAFRRRFIRYFIV